MARIFDKYFPPAGRAILAGLAIAAALLVVAAGASASSLEEYKTAGKIGEQTDGFVAAVAAEPAAEVTRVVDDINRRRQEKYTAIAAKNGTEASTVAKLAGEKLVKRAAARCRF